MAGAQIPTGVTILNSYLGYHGVSLTNFASDSAPLIAAGSKIEIAGAFFTFSSDDTIDATSWSAISTGAKAYITLTPSGTAGSQIVSAAWTSTEPVYSTSKQGYYTSSGSSIRVIGGCTKTGASTYNRKFILNNHQPDRRIETFTSSGTYTTGPNQTEVFLTGTAAGGNGGTGATGGTTTPSGGGGAGGAAGQACVKYRVAVSPSTAYTITIGAVGSDTSFGALLTLTKGANGANGSGSTGGTGVGGGGSGGAGNSDANTTAASGSVAFGPYSATVGSGGIGGGGLGFPGGGGGGAGAPSQLQQATNTGGAGGAGGSGTNPGSAGSAGSAATAYGAGGGGGGGGSGSSVAKAGGAGGAGGPAILIVEW